MIPELTIQGAKELGIKLPSEAGAAFGAYYEFLVGRGEHVNLTAISEPADVVRLHFLDSLALLEAAPFDGANVIDIGSGAGFPGVPLKLANPSIRLTLLDATRKRTDFLSELCTLIGVDAVCLHARAEVAAHLPDLRERYDICVSRAVARLNALCELCLPFVGLGGIFIAMKTTDTDEELAEAQNAIAILGGEACSSYDYKIPGTDRTHRAIIIKKTSPIPSKYPRRFARIQKNPL